MLIDLKMKERKKDDDATDDGRSKSNLIATELPSFLKVNNNDRLTE